MSNPTRTINIRYFALLREQRGVEQESLTTAAINARDLYADIAKIYHLSLPVNKISVAINNAFCTVDQPLNDGDNVVFIPPVAGG